MFMQKKTAIKIIVKPKIEKNIIFLFLKNFIKKTSFRELYYIKWLLFFVEKRRVVKNASHSHQIVIKTYTKIKGVDGFMNLVYFIIYLFLASFGVLYFLNFLQYIFLKDKKDVKRCYNVTIIPISGHVEDVEYLVRKNLAKNNTNNFFKQTDVIFVDYGVDEETKKILNRLWQAHNFTICEQDKIYDILILKRTQ